MNLILLIWLNENVRLYSVESRQNKPKANHRNLLSTEHGESGKKLKLKKRSEEGVRVHFRL